MVNHYLYIALTSHNVYFTSLDILDIDESAYVYIECYFADAPLNRGLLLHIHTTSMYARTFFLFIKCTSHTNY